MAMVTVQSAADPSTLARKAVLAMCHVLLYHGRGALRTMDFLTSAGAIERLRGEQHEQEETAAHSSSFQVKRNVSCMPCRSSLKRLSQHSACKLTFQELPRRPRRTHAAGYPLIDTPVHTACSLH